MNRESGTQEMLIAVCRSWLNVMMAKPRPVSWFVLFGVSFAFGLPGSCGTDPSGNGINLYIHGRGKAATRDHPRSRLE